MRHLSLAVGCLCLVATEASAFRLSLDAGILHVNEGDGAFEITVLIEEGPFTGPVSVRATDGSAQLGSDYTGLLDTQVTFTEGDPSPKTIVYPIVDDDVFESLESLELTLIAAGDIGTHTQTIVRFFDDDGPISAYIDSHGLPIAGDGFLNLAGEQGETLPVTVKLTDNPKGVVTVDFTSTWPPTSGTLTFSGTRTQVVEVMVPTSTETLVEGSFLIQSVNGARADGVPLDWQAHLLGWSWAEACLSCFYVNQHCTVKFATVAEIDSCVASAGAGHCATIGRGEGTPSSMLDTFTRYRDEVLAATTIGQQYITAYVEHSPAMIRAVIENPREAYRTGTRFGGWLSAIHALADGNGGDVTVNAAMQEALSYAATFFETHGGPELATFVATARSDLDIDNLTGLTVQEAQDRLENDTVPVVRQRWGGMKGLFRTK